MLQWKSAWSICPQCRLRLLGAAANRRAAATSILAGASTSFRQSRSLAQPRFTSLPSTRRLLHDTSPLRGAQGARKEKEIEAREHPPPPLEEHDASEIEPREEENPIGEEDIIAREEEIATSEDEPATTEEGNAIVEDELSDVTSAEEAIENAGVRATPEEMAQAARNFFGDSLPEGALSPEEFTIYKRMYGEPSEITTEHLSKTGQDEDESSVLLRANADGTVDEFEYVEEPQEDQVVDEDADLDEEDIEDVDELSDDVALLNEQVADRELQQVLDTSEEVSLTFGEISEQATPAKSRTRDEILEDIYENWPEDDLVRSHPFTEAGKFGTKPSTLQLPEEAFVKPIQAMLANVANKHISEAAQKTLGGVGIPDSPSTPAVGRSKGQRPVPLTALQSKMSPMDANVFVTSIMPQVYASAVSVLVECRKRMGSAWLRGLMKKEGGPLILDAGAGGSAIVAIRELLRAEWESLQEEAGINATTNEEEQKQAPMGRATVVTGSDSLRSMASTLLENTTFIPRLPDYVDPTGTESNAQQPRKRYDIIVAPHTLWPLTEEHERKVRTQTLWSLLNPDGGLLVLIEKGVPRGFEVVASARDLLLRKHISSPGMESYENTIEERGTLKGAKPRKERYTPKEKGSIVAPCTNHVQCPLYTVPGVSRGRKDWCYFQQRYTRPKYLMSVLQAKARNHDDVEFSYLAVQRGVDIRNKEDDQLLGEGFTQGDAATSRAKEGYGPKRSPKETDEDVDEDLTEEAVEEESEITASAIEQPHPLSLPRIIPAPLKRKGHILLDVCTPSGTYERWMVRRGLGKQAFRDARKAKWGDLWAMGASTSETKRTRLGTPIEVVRLTSKRERERAKGYRKGRDGGKGKWRYGDVET